MNDKIVIGFYHIRSDPNKVSRAYLYTAIAKIEGAELFYFTSRNVDLTSKTILGKYYENGEWIEKIFQFPDVIINAANQTTKNQIKIKKELEKIIPFTSYPIGSKIAVFNRMKKSNYLKSFIIPYQEFQDLEQFFNFLDIHKKIVIKPVRGHHGNDLISIEKKEEYYIINFKNEYYNFSKNELIEYLKSIKKRMVMQKYIYCRLDTGEPYDYRIHMQKNNLGIWNISIIIPRIGLKKRVITNLSQGSQMIEFNSFLDSHFNEEANTIKQIIEDFSMNFVINFENLYSYEFDELGIDIGMDENKKIWIYEVNWRPGHVFIEVITGRNSIRYAIFKAKRLKMK